MRYYVVIPAFNEEKYLAQALDSLVAQTLAPAKVVVVNDNSTDGTESVIDWYVARFPYIEKCNTVSKPEHASGAKVVHAFNQGAANLDGHFDVIVKLDADIVLPPDYFRELSDVFKNDQTVGVAGGFAYELDKEGNWLLQHPMNKDHVRGGFKSYSSTCFKAIGGLKPATGWDTVDELLARYHGFKIVTLDRLKVKHLRPLGSAYSRKSWISQGAALYRMRYGWLLALIATVKMALKHGKPRILFDNLKGYRAAHTSGDPYLVSREEGDFIRRYRWKNIAGKLF